MHEATMVAGILRIATEEAEQYHARSIVAVRLDVGLLTCLEEQTLKGCFEIFAEGTIAQGARLDIHVLPLECTCQKCGQAFVLTKRDFTCPHCHDKDIFFKGGHGCAISAIEVESEENKS